MDGLFDILLKLYQNYIYYLLWCIFIILAGLLILNFGKISRKFGKVSKKSWGILLIIFVIGLIARFFLFPHTHVVYTDEFAYMEFAKNMNEEGKPKLCWYDGIDSEICYTQVKPMGWPFLISILFLFTGLSNYAVLHFSSVIGSLSIILIFLFCYLLFKNENIALWSAFLYSLTLLNIYWASSAETNSIAIFFILLTLVIYLLYLDTKDKYLFMSAFFSFAFTFFVRFDNFIIGFIIILLHMAYYFDERNNYPISWLKVFSPIIIAAMITLIVFVQKMYLGLFGNNFYFDLYYMNMLFILKASTFKHLYLVLAIIPLISYDKKDKNKIKAILISTFLLLIFYSQTYLASRFALVPMLFFIFLAAYSFERLTLLFKKYSKNIHIYLSLFFIITISVNYAIYLRTQPNTTDSSMEAELSGANYLIDVIDKKCYIITESPVILNAISNHKVIPTRVFLQKQNVFGNIGSSCFYYFHDRMCLYSYYSAQKRCAQMMDKFNYDIVSEFEYNNGKLCLYRLKDRIQ